MLLNGQFFIYVVVKINIILLRKHDTQWKATRVLLKIIFLWCFILEILFINELTGVLTFSSVFGPMMLSVFIFIFQMKSS